VHEKVICNRSKFISKQVAAGSDTNQDFTFPFPDYSPTLFRVYLHWIYTGDLGGAFDSPNDKTFLQLTKAYNLGDKLGDDAFMKQIKVTIKADCCVACKTLCDATTKSPPGMTTSSQMDETVEPAMEEPDGSVDPLSPSESMPASPAIPDHPSSLSEQAESSYSTRSSPLSEIDSQWEHSSFFKPSLPPEGTQEIIHDATVMVSTPEPTSDSTSTSTDTRTRKKAVPRCVALMRKRRQYEESLERGEGKRARLYYMDSRESC
jgi:hypothetical protein